MEAACDKILTKMLKYFERGSLYYNNIKLAVYIRGRFSGHYNVDAKGCFLSVLGCCCLVRTLDRVLLICLVTNTDCLLNMFWLYGMV